jgi:hypothetical protein
MEQGCANDMPDWSGASDDDETIEPWYNDDGELGSSLNDEDEDE